MKTVYIALGANLSNPKTTFTAALDKLASMGIEIVKVSGLWQSPAWPPGTGHPDYLNAAAKIGFEGEPKGLLGILNGIEAEFGRVRAEKNAPRSLDLDILDFDGLITDDPQLSLPHPRMLSRGFILFPLAEVAANWIDPVAKTALTTHIAKLPLKDVEKMQYIGRFYDHGETGHQPAQR